ncbi:hypothetical protein QN219_06855 [Sinorhizobium sp. 7-81]|uniref:hypothetical protein n=1 Tax=Sinorhizobium sp. 8-89 TaxID=3049089 RepID=UPI0024C42FAA|nr:hypothetical protein [Sinorhizobium sp. 8-89]MDK1489774.1 hypothetical protein [Sinorhizobium sp. 8-89]
MSGMRISAIVEALVTAGATPEMILSAVSAAEAHSLEALERRRASDRARQQRRRQRLAREAMAVDGAEGESAAACHGTVGDSPVTGRDAPLPDKERSPVPPKEINPTRNPISAGAVPAGSVSAGPQRPDVRGAAAGILPAAPRQGEHPAAGRGQAGYQSTEHRDALHCGAEAAAPGAVRREGEHGQAGGLEPRRGEGKRDEGKRGEGKRRATRLPEGFVPDWTFAAGEGFGRAEAEAEFEKFRDYWSAKAGREATKLDWPATWRNWIRNAGRPRSFGGRAPPRGGLRPKGDFRAHQDEVQRELDRALGRAGVSGRAGASGRSGEWGAAGDDDFTGTTFELERGDWQARR